VGLINLDLFELKLRPRDSLPPIHLFATIIVQIDYGLTKLRTSALPKATTNLSDVHKSEITLWWQGPHSPMSIALLLLGQVRNYPLIAAL